MQVAYWWSDRPGGGYEAHLRHVYGRTVPALLMDAVLVYGVEVVEAVTVKAERQREDVGWKERTARMLRGEMPED